MKIKAIDSAYALLLERCPGIEGCSCSSETCCIMKKHLSAMPKTAFCAKQCLKLAMLFPYCQVMAETVGEHANLLGEERDRNAALNMKNLCAQLHEVTARGTSSEKAD